MILEHSNAAPYSVQQTQESCCSHVTGNLWTVQHMVLTLTTGLLFWASDTTFARSPIVQQEECRSLISAMTVVKIMQRWDKCVRVPWDCVKINDTSGNNCASFYEVATVIQITSMT